MRLNCRLVLQGWGIPLQVINRLLLLASPVSQEPQSFANLEAFSFDASARLPMSVQPFQLIKSADPNLADALYLSGDCRIRRVVTFALLLSDTVLGQSTLFTMLLNCS